MDMNADVREALLKQQAFWDAFPEWESRCSEDISLEQRIAWYAAAFDFAVQFVRPASMADIQQRASLLEL